MHRKIIPIEGNAKCRHITIIDLYRDSVAGVFLSEAQNSIPPPLPYTLYTCIQYTFSHREVGEEGERVEPQRRGEGQQVTQSWVENTNMTDCISSL